MELIRKTICGKYLIEVSQKELDDFRIQGELPPINLKDIKSLKKAKKIQIGQKVIIDDVDERPYWVCFTGEDEHGRYYIRVGERFKNMKSWQDDPKNPCIIIRVFQWEKQFKALSCVVACCPRAKGHPNDSKDMKKRDAESYKKYDEAISLFEKW